MCSDGADTACCKMCGGLCSLAADLPGMTKYQVIVYNDRKLIDLIIISGDIISNDIESKLSMKKHILDKDKQ